MPKEKQEINLRKYLINPLIGGYVLLAIVLFLISYAITSNNMESIGLLIIISFFPFIFVLLLAITSYCRIHRILYIEKKFQNERSKLKKILLMNIILFIIILFLFIIFFSNFFVGFISWLI